MFEVAFLFGVEPAQMAFRDRLVLGRNAFEEVFDALEREGHLIVQCFEFAFDIDLGEFRWSLGRRLSCALR